MASTEKDGEDGLTYVNRTLVEALKVVRYLYNAEHMGVKLLSSNAAKLHALLSDYERVADGAVAVAWGQLPKLAAHVQSNRSAHAAALCTLAELRPFMKDEETLAAHFDAVQGGLEGVLPSTKAYLESLLATQLPLAAGALSAGAHAQLVAGIRAQQAAQAAEEEARKTAEAAAFAKTRAGKRIKALEDEKRREVARAKAEAEGGGKKKKSGGTEEDEAARSVKEAAAARRAERAARAAAKGAPASAVSTPATIVGEAGQLLDTLHL